MVRILLIALLSPLLSSCVPSNTIEEQTEEEVYADVKVVGAMKEVMWKGELAGKIKLDTIKNKRGLYGLGPLEFLSGEILVLDGKPYYSKVVSDSTMIVEKSDQIAAPFFVYGNINEWLPIELPPHVNSIQDIERFVDDKTQAYKRPFPFKIIGTIDSAIIHIQNLPPGAKVSSPKDAHQGQVKYKLYDENVEIIGFFSLEHQGVFTHHDAFVHMHLITADKQKMGHLDEVSLGEMTLYLPIR